MPHLKDYCARFLGERHKDKRREAEVEAVGTAFRTCVLKLMVKPHPSPKGGMGLCVLFCVGGRLFEVDPSMKARAVIDG